MSEFLDDLTKATNLFNSGMQKLTLQRSLTKANDAIQQTNQSELADNEKKEELKALGQQLTLNLTGAGIPASTIQTLNESLGTQAEKDRLYQTAEQVLFNEPEGSPKRKAAEKHIETKQARALELQEERLQSAEDIAGVKITAAKQKEERKLARKNIEKFDSLQNDFREKMIPEERKSIKAAADLQAVLASSKSKATIGVAVRQLIRISGDPRPSDKDVDGVAPNSSLAKKAKRAIHELFLNNRLPEDAAVLKIIADALVAQQKRIVKTKILRYASGKRNLINEIGSSPTELANSLVEIFLGGPKGKALGEQLEQAKKDAKAPPSPGRVKRPGARVLGRPRN